MPAPRRQYPTHRATKEGGGGTQKRVRGDTEREGGTMAKEFWSQIPGTGKLIGNSFYWDNNSGTLAVTFLGLSKLSILLWTTLLVDSILL